MKTKLSFILLFVMLLSACGQNASSSLVWTLPSTQSGEVKDTFANFGFDPASLTITTGTTVTWTNNDTASHNIAGNDGASGSNSLAEGEAFSFAFTKPGTFSYHCGVHQSMKASITVVAA